jgi:N-acetylglucosamine-6-sulfatase
MKFIIRHDFFTRALCVFFVIVLITSCVPARIESDVVVVLPRDNRPNIIFILVDDLDERLGTMEYMSNLKTLLSDQGVIIEDFLVTTPMCCPSRVNFLRGQYTHNHQVYNNEAPYGGFPKFFETGEESSTLAVWLQAAGYRTALIGKYLNAYPLQDDRTYIPPGWSEWYSPARKSGYRGYDYYLNENGTLVAYPPKVEFYLTDVMSRKGVDFIQRAADDSIPFFLFLSPFVPHAPAVPARRHEDLLPSITAPHTPSFNEEDVSDKPPNLSRNPLLTEEEIVRIDRIYRNRVLSMLAVDDMIVDIVNALEQTGQMDNTYIVFTSDQGFHLGQHRMFQGKSTFYEEDIVVPFIVSGPGIPEGKIIPAFLAGSVDIAPTFAEWAGVEPPEFVDGRSLTGVLTGDDVPSDWRQAFLLEFYAFSMDDEDEAALSTMFGIFDMIPLLSLERSDVLPKWAGLRTLRYTYIEHPDGFVELYDLQEDPYQLENLASTDDLDVLRDFSVWLKALENCRAKECRQLEQGILR